MTADLCQEFVRGAFTIAAAGVAARIGFWVFLRQKEFELVQQRYLEGAIDVVAAHHEEVMGIFLHNWARCQQIIKTFRDGKDAFDIKELEKGFLPLDSSQFHVIAHYRLQLLVGSQVFWETYQLALSFAANSNAQVSKEIPEMIRLKLTTSKISDDIDKIVEDSFKRLEELQKESHKFEILTRELEALAGMLQTENLTFKKVLKFRNQPRVKASVVLLRKEFSQELDAYHGNDA